jgi:preprotein translocase subunit SecF
VSIRRAFWVFRGHEVPHFELIRRRNLWFALSGVFIALSIFGLAARGLNFSIAFTGGSQIQFTNRSGANVGDFQGIMARYGRPDAEVSVLRGSEVTIKTDSLSGLGARADQLRRDLAREAGISVSQIGNEQDVSSTWGSAISRKAIVGLIVFLIAVSVYISFRFEWKMAASALAALGHDLVITAGIYALVGREVTPETIIAVLTILGYSLYDTVVIFDKVKENAESAAMVARDTYSGVVNTSLNQTLMRSVNTSLVVLLPIGALLVFGGQTLKDFAFALFIGVASGAYSSIFIAAPMVALLKEREPRYQQIRTRAQARGARAGLRAATAPAEPDGGTGTERELQLAPARTATATGAGSRTGSSSAPVRPRPTSSAKRKKAKSQGKAKRRRR